MVLFTLDDKDKILHYHCCQWDPFLDYRNSANGPLVDQKKDETRRVSVNLGPSSSLPETKVAPEVLFMVGPW